MAEVLLKKWPRVVLPPAAQTAALNVAKLKEQWYEKG
jgi:hypothetical protein